MYTRVRARWTGTQSELRSGVARLEARFRPCGVHLLTCKEVEDENDDENENDWGSGGGEPSIAGIVCLKAIDQSGQHCYKTRDHFLTGFLLASFLPKSSSSFVVVLVLGLWFYTDREWSGRAPGACSYLESR